MLIVLSPPTVQGKEWKEVKRTKPGTKQRTIEKAKDSLESSIRLGRNSTIPDSVRTGRIVGVFALHLQFGD